MSLVYTFEHRNWKSKPYKVRDLQESEGIVGTRHNIEWYAQKVCYYKQDDLTVYDIAQILYQFSYHYDVKLCFLGVSETDKYHHAVFSQQDYEQMKEIIEWGIDICFDNYCDYHKTNTVSYFDFPVLDCSDIKLYYSRLNRIFEVTMGVTGNGKGLYNNLAQSQHNLLIVDLAWRCLRGTYIPQNTHTQLVPEIMWYKLIFGLNETIQGVLDNWNITNIEDYLMKETTLNKLIKQQPRKRKAYEKMCEEARQEAQREWERKQEEIKEWESIRNARMERYDKLCDKFGCALPYSSMF